MARKSSKIKRFRKYRVETVGTDYPGFDIVKLLMAYENAYFDKKNLAWRYIYKIGDIPLTGWERSAVLFLAIRKPLDLL